MPVAFLTVLAALAFLFIPFWPVQWAAVFWLAVVVLSWMYREIIRLNLQVSRRERRIATFRHQDARMEILVRNGAFLPLPMLGLTDSTGTLYHGDENAFLMALRPREGRTLHYPLRGHTRGRYPVGPIHIRTADPLGLFPLHVEIDANAEFLVYPRILDIQIPRRGGIAGGRVRTPHTLQEDTSRFRSLRDYSPGDETRRISWKASARTGGLKTVEYLRTVTVPSVVLLNLAQEDYQERQRHRAVERAIEIAASLTVSAGEGSQPVGLITNGRLEAGPVPVLPVRSGYAHTVAVLETLAEIAMRGAAGLPGESPAPAGAAVAPAGAWRELLDPLAALPRGYGMRLFYVGPPLHAERMRELVAVWGAASAADLFHVHGLEREAERAGSVSGWAVHDVQLFGGVSRQLAAPRPAHGSGGAS